MTTRDGVFRILGPSRPYYQDLLREIEARTSVREAAKSLMADILETARARLVKESLEQETLRDDGVTSPQNNTSVISLMTFGDAQFLFTADAGIPALEQVLDRLQADGFNPGDFGFVQVPHH